MPETLIGTLENPKPNPRGFCAKLAHFWAKVQKPSQIGFLLHRNNPLEAFDDNFDGLGAVEHPRHHGVRPKIILAVPVSPEALLAGNRA